MSKKAIFLRIKRRKLLYSDLQGFKNLEGLSTLIAYK